MRNLGAGAVWAGAGCIPLVDKPDWLPPWARNVSLLLKLGFGLDADKVVFVSVVDSWVSSG